ncbi:MAG: adenosylcobinamide-GDP ribazoletransferase [Pseudomonadota bacterium]
MIKDQLHDVVTCLRFLTRIPVPEHWFAHKEPHFGRIAWALPAAGCVSSLPAILVLLLLVQTSLPALATAVFALATLVVVQGALHEDGLADVCDGFGGGSKERKLEIMSDSRIGSYGTLGLIFAMMARVALIVGSLASLGPAGSAALLLFAAAGSRLAMVWLWSFLLPAKYSGLSERFGEPEADQVFKAALFCGAVAIVLIFVALPIAAVLVGAIVAAIVVWAFSHLAEKQIGGHTGDVLGATQIICEIALYVGFLVAI